MLVQQLSLGEESYHSAPEVLISIFETCKGKIDKGPLFIKPALEKNRMKMGILPEHIPESLMSYDHSAAYLFTGNLTVEIADHGEYHFRNLCEKPPVMAKKHPQGFREGKNKLTMRKTQEYFLIQVFGKEKCSLLAAGGTQIKPLAGERAEIVVPTVRVTAANTG